MVHIYLWILELIPECAVIYFMVHIYLWILELIPECAVIYFMVHIYLWILELVPEGAEKPLEWVAGKHNRHTVLRFTISFIQ